MTEAVLPAIEGLQDFAPTLELRAQRVPFIPRALTESEIAKQLPDGDVAYIFADDPNVAIAVDQKTWKPIMEGGKKRTRKMRTYNVAMIAGRRFAAVIVSTPPLRRDDEHFEDTLKRAGQIVGRDIDKTESGIITNQNLGAVFILEGKPTEEQIKQGEQQNNKYDRFKNWRTELLRDATKEIKISWGNEKIKTVMTNVNVRNDLDNVIITEGRLGKERSPIDLLHTGKTQYWLAHQLERIPLVYGRLGYSVDIRRLIKDLSASKNPPLAIVNAKDANDTTFVDNECGRCTWFRDRKGVISRIDACDDTSHAQKEAPPTMPKEELKIRTEVMDGEKNEMKCTKCDSHLRQDTLVSSRDENDDSINVHIQTYCPKRNCQGQIASERRHMSEDMFVKRYLGDTKTVLEATPDSEDILPFDDTPIKINTITVNAAENSGPICGDYPEHGTMSWNEKRKLFVCKICG